MSSFPQSDLARHEYQLKTWQKMLYLLLGMIFVAIGTVFGPALFSSGANGFPPILIALFFLGLGVFMLAQAFRSRLAIEGSRIEVRGAFRERTADMADIEGFRTVSSRNGSFTQLQLKQGQGTISIPNAFETDESYRAWMQQVPDLDKRDREQILDEISKEAELGATPQERLAAVSTAKTWAVFLSIVTGIAAAALAFGPASLGLPAAAALALAPVVALFLMQRAPLLYAIFKPKADPRGELSFVLILAGFGLLIHCVGLHFVSVQQLMYLIVPIALMCAVAFFTAGKGSRPGTFVALLFFIGLYSYGLGVVADTIADHADSTTYSTQVLDKHVSHGRSTTYYLEIAPWGPIASPSQVSVSSRIYNAADPGDQVCLRLHPGSLHVPWYRVTDCSEQYGTSSTQ